jgi:amidophosphoribosyltransferase
MTDLNDIDTIDCPKEECGIIGVHSVGYQAARKAYFGLYALQHRGQESSGIASAGNADDKTVHYHKAMGLVSQIYNENVLRELPGYMAIGHNRYSTTGDSSPRNAAPHVIDTLDGMLAVAHNGNITNAAELRQDLLARGVGLVTTTDSELLTLLLAMPLPVTSTQSSDLNAAPIDPVLTRLKHLQSVAQGAYSLLVLTANAIYATRDALGLRPLCLGVSTDEQGRVMHVVSSESCALQPVGATFVRDIQAGEIIKIDHAGVTVLQAGVADKPKALCVFEYVYFARPDSTIEARSVNTVRQEMGRKLWQQAPVDADVVVGVPDSAVPCALGLAQASGIPYVEGLTKNRYIGRTFIQPDDALRKLGVKLKFTALADNIAGKRIILVDDSIVRGNTVAPLIALLREAGAKEVHVRVSSPPIKHPCFMGVDMASRRDMIANRFENESAIARYVGADSLVYLNVDTMESAVQSCAKNNAGQVGLCNACFTGQYPLDLPAGKDGFEGFTSGCEAIKK